MKRVLVLAALVIVAIGVHLETRAPAPTAVRTPQADSGASAAVRGRAVYDHYGCAACHGADAKGGFSNPNSETEGKVPGVNFVAEGYTRRELGVYVLKGQPTIGKTDPKGQPPPYRMPGWTGQMTDRDASDLVEYLFSIYPKSDAVKFR